MSTMAYFKRKTFRYWKSYYMICRPKNMKLDPADEIRISVAVKFNRLKSQNFLVLWLTVIWLPYQLCMLICMISESLSNQNTLFILMPFNLQSINQSIKSSFVKGAGAHPQNAPCRRRSHALKKAPVRRGRLLSTVFHRWSPRQSILSAGLR